MEQIVLEGWPDCLRLSNGETEVIVATGIGLRVLRFGFIGGPNVFYLDPATLGMSGGNEWRIYGGHRLWQAPETFPGSYTPDNHPILYFIDQDTLVLSQPVDVVTGLVKEMAVTLAADNTVSVLHRLINRNPHSVSCAPWAISVMAAGGTAILPQEPYGEGNDYLLPARSLALWSYTRMNDARWNWGDRYITATHIPAVPGEQKIGILNRQGWSAYLQPDHLFLKTFSFDPLAVYPDLGCNNEIYFNGDFLEIESLGPLISVPPGGRTEHHEYWSVSKANAAAGKADFDAILLPEVQRLAQKHLLPGLVQI